MQGEAIPWRLIPVTFRYKGGDLDPEPARITTERYLSDIAKGACSALVAKVCKPKTYSIWNFVRRTYLDFGQFAFSTGHQREETQTRPSFDNGGVRPPATALWSLSRRRTSSP